jgi:hypothetical protein
VAIDINNPGINISSDCDFIRFVIVR